MDRLVVQLPVVLLVTLCHFRHVMWLLLPTSNYPMCRAQIKITPFIYICQIAKESLLGIGIHDIHYPRYDLIIFFVQVSQIVTNQTNTQQGLSSRLSQKLHTAQHVCSQACLVVCSSSR